MHAAFLIAFLVLLVGCSPSTTTRPQRTGIVVPSDLTTEEAAVIAIARQFLSTNQTWPDAEFERPKRRKESGWSVLIWKLPATPESDMLLHIDDTGRVTYSHIGL